METKETKKRGRKPKDPAAAKPAKATRTRKAAKAEPQPAETPKAVTPQAAEWEPTPTVKIPVSWQPDITAMTPMDTRAALLLLMYCKKAGSRRIPGARNWTRQEWFTRIGCAPVRYLNTKCWQWQKDDLLVVFGMREH